ncbi:MAG: hypothetical protein AB7S80_02215 [Rhizobiaceae bacterium]
MTALSRLLVILGFIVIIAAIGWWYVFYNALIEQAGLAGLPGVSVTDLSFCIYTMGPECSAGPFGHLMEGGVPPYKAIAFWAGVAAIVIGVVMKVMASQPARRA